VYRVYVRRLCVHTQIHSHTLGTKVNMHLHRTILHIRHVVRGKALCVWKMGKMGRQAVFAKAHYPQKCVRVFSAFALVAPIRKKTETNEENIESA